MTSTFSPASHRTARMIATALVLPLLSASAASAQGTTAAQQPVAKHHSKTKGAAVGAATGAVVGGPVGAVAGAAVGAEVQHHKNKKARRQASTRP